MTPANEKPLMRWALYALLAALPAAAHAEAPLAVASLWQALGFSKSEQFLEPDQAFAFSADALDSGTVVARWQIARDYYLYRDKFSFRVIDQPEVSLGEPVFPPGGAVKQDEYFGVMVVYFNQVDVTVPITRKDPAVKRIRLEASYQGCAEAGFCYAPMTKTVELALPPGDAVAPAAAK
jgi:thiol:disulfide interchange protein DsbD